MRKLLLAVLNKVFLAIVVAAFVIILKAYWVMWKTGMPPADFPKAATWEPLCYTLIALGILLSSTVIEERVKMKEFSNLRQDAEDIKTKLGCLLTRHESNDTKPSKDTTSS